MNTLHSKGALHSAAQVLDIIHSLDACMLHMVSERALEDGVELIDVHDEYAVHLCDIEWLQRNIPEMFVKMLQGDVMQQILNDLEIESL